jgi:hypothetical protein
MRTNQVHGNGPIPTTEPSEGTVQSIQYDGSRQRTEVFIGFDGAVQQWTIEEQIEPLTDDHNNAETNSHTSSTP